MKFLEDAPDIIRVKNGKLIAPTKYIKKWAEANDITEDVAVCVIASDDLQKLIDRSNRAVVRCHFCTKSNNEVFCMIQGFDCFICDECVSVCNDIIAEKKTENKALTMKIEVNLSNDQDAQGLKSESPDTTTIDE